MLLEDAGTKAGFNRVFAAPDDPARDRRSAGPVAGDPWPLDAALRRKASAKRAATDAVTDALTRCRASQRRCRNTLLFVAADEAQSGDGP